MTAHINSKEEEIAKKVIMPGDPLRAKYIAEHFLEDAKCINTVRNMLGYTGYYKQEKITVFASGMGGGSIGIYAYELYHFYGVEEIIRIGTAGSNQPDVEVGDVVLATEAYTLSSYPKLFFNDDARNFQASNDLNEKINKTAQKEKIKLKEGPILTSDIFDVYVNREEYQKNYPTNLHALANEMEGAILFVIAKNLKKQASCLLTIVDSIFTGESLSSEQRESSLNYMILLALNSLVVK